MDYYKILNCDKNSDENAIKKAYKKMALKYHPDRNHGNVEEAKVEFNKVQEAYEVLSDEKKRKIYDKYGYKGLKDYEENNFGNQHPQHKQKTVKEIKYTIQELYEQKTKNFNYNIKKQCVDCLGSGAFEKSICNECDGKGMQVRIQRMGPFVQQMQQPCMFCNGKGIKVLKKCKQCNGKCFIKELMNIEFNIDGSCYDKIHEVYEDIGDEDEDGNKSDLVLVVKEVIDERFKRRGFDLHIKEKIHLYDSLVGLKKTIEFIDGRKLYINENIIITDNDVRRIENYGLKKNDGTYGDLIIEYNIIYPNEVLDKNVLKQLNMESDNKEKEEDSIEVTCIDFENNVNKIGKDNQFRKMPHPFTGMPHPFGININESDFDEMNGMPDIHNVQQCAQS